MLRGILRRKWNRLFGGGCPLCGGDGSLTPETRLGIVMNLACESCGTRFSKTVAASTAGERSQMFYVAEGDAKHLGKTYKVSDWAKVRRGETPKTAVTVPSGAVRFPQVCANCLNPQPDRTFTVQGASKALRVTAIYSTEAPICSSCHEEIFRKKFSLKSRKPPVTIVVAPQPAAVPGAEPETGPFAFSFENTKYAELFKASNVAGAKK